MDKAQLREKIVSIIIDAVRDNKNGYESPYKYADDIVMLFIKELYK